MLEKYIVLRDLEPVSTQRGFRGFGSPAQRDNFAVSSEEYQPTEAAQTQHKDPTVRAMAPRLPIAMVEPVARGSAASGSEGADIDDNVAWGIRAVGADRSDYTGQGVTVAVLDTGIQRSHPAFNGRDIVEKDFTGEGDGDSDGHGTHCAGTFFGADVDGVRIGVARGVSRCLIGKVLAQKTISTSNNIVDGLMWAARQQAEVISMSLGIDFPGYVKQLLEAGLPPEIATSRALEGYRSTLMLFERVTSVVRMLVPNGVVIAAAGNESRRSLRSDFQVAASPPAAVEGVISVAALGRGSHGMVVASFSNTGALVSGPGVDIVSAGIKGGLTRMSGTSMAAPHVAGVAALWAQQLRKTGLETPGQLGSSVRGRASVAGLAAGFEVGDTGAGMVMAP